MSLKDAMIDQHVSPYISAEDLERMKELADQEREIDDLKEEIARLKKDNSPEAVYQQFLDWRNISVVCTKCSGTGQYAYPNTATWSGGIGGQAITMGVCNRCWGSGDPSRPGADLKGIDRFISNQNDEIEKLKAALKITAKVSLKK